MPGLAGQFCQMESALRQSDLSIAICTVKSLQSSPKHLGRSLFCKENNSSNDLPFPLNNVVSSWSNTYEKCCARNCRQHCLGEWGKNFTKLYKGVGFRGSLKSTNKG